MGEELLLTVGGNVLSNLGSAIVGNEMGKANSDRLWRERYSPQAQVRNLAAAGINPAVAMGNNAPVLSSGGEINPVDVSPFGIGTTALSEIGNYINATANAKKAGVDTKSTEEDIKLKRIEQDRNDFELKLRKQYGLKLSAQELSLAEANVRLAQLSGDNSEIDKAIKEYTKAKEKAISECNEVQRDILQKELDNKDTQLKLSNRVLQTQGDSNIAAANQANTQASVNRQNRRLQSALADIEEAGKDDKIRSLLSRYQADGVISDRDYQEAVNKLNRLIDVSKKRNDDSENWNLFRETDNFLDWLKDKVSIFK